MRCGAVRRAGDEDRHRAERGSGKVEMGGEWLAGRRSTRLEEAASLLIGVWTVGVSSHQHRGGEVEQLCIKLLLSSGPQADQ
jgi:hypothetical protein